MSRKSGRVRRAVKAHSSELLACLGDENPLPFLKIAHSSELQEKEKIAIWDLFQENMFDLYSNSSFGWKPAERKKEIFHNLSRFLLVYDSEEAANMLAFCLFRFENDEGEIVVYWYGVLQQEYLASIIDYDSYDIQISSRYRRNGIGKKLLEILFTIGKAFEMEKIVLTVLKANTKAIAFYEACNFVIDPGSPSLYLPEDDPSRGEYDYEIMSRGINL